MLASRPTIAAALAAALLLLAPCAVLRAQTGIPADASAAEARVIVKFKPESPLLRMQALSIVQGRSDRADALGKRIGLPMQAGREMAERMMVVKASGLSSRQLAERLVQQTDVEYAVPDRRRQLMATPNDPLFVQGGANGPVVGQWYLRTPAEVPAAINATAAWDITKGRSDVVVAVLDTGVRFDHPDLLRAAAGGKLLDGYDMIHDVFTANDGDARDPDPSDPGDWVTQSEITSHPSQCPTGTTPSDSSWHGTQVAGIVGALSDNGIGMAGTAWNVKVLPVRVLGKCGGWDSDIIDGMRWAAGIDVPGVPHNANPARVINMSLGGDGACSTVYQDAVNAVTAAGAVVVVSAGNSTGHAVKEPANCNGVIGVSGLRHTGTKVAYSDIGPEIALSAPGGNCVNSTGACLYPILTTTNTGTQGPVSAVYSDAVNPSLGTSFSAPLVSGAAALMLSINPALTPADVRQMLRSTARPFPTVGAAAGTPACAAPTTTDQSECYCTASTCGAGMLDAGAAVLAAAGVHAHISVSPAQPVPNQAVQLDGSGSFIAPGRTITSYAWALTSGGGIVSALPVPANTASISVTPTAAGQFTVSLTVTDSKGVSSQTSQTVAVAAASPGTSSGGGGGGALGWPYLLALLAAVAAAHAGRARAVAPVPPAAQRG